MTLRNRLAGFGPGFWMALGWLGLVVLSAITASWLPLDPNAIDPTKGGIGPRLSRPFGTTSLGEDIFALVIHGSRVAIMVALGSAFVSLVVGAPLGLLAGYFRGPLDTAVTTVLDAVVAFPAFVLASSIVLFLGQSVLTVVLVIGFVTAPLMARVTRSATRAIVDREFVVAARMSGAGHRRLMWQELRPNIAVPVLAYALLIMGVAILAEGGLSFVGLGAPADKASWGRLIAGGRGELERAWWWSMCPSAVFFLTILSLNVANDRVQARWLLGRPLPKGRARTRRQPEPGAVEPVARPKTTVPPVPGARLRVDRLSTSIATPFGTVRVLEDISLELQPGRVLALVGESGAGKTMLANSILGLLPPGSTMQGEVLLDGTNLATLTQQQLRRHRGRDVAVVFQDPQTALDPVMTVGWQIAEPARVHLGLSRALARAGALELMRSVGIAEPERRFGQYPHQLSGGMRQRAAIALALSCGPQLLIADEPTSALDVTVQAQILSLIDRLRRDRHMAVLLITHDLHMAATFADEIAVMYAGRIVERAPAQTLLRSARMRYTEALLAAAPKVSAPSHTRLSAIAGQPPNPFLRPPGCAFAPRCAFATELCTQDRPPLRGDSGHIYACWHPSDG